MSDTITHEVTRDLEHLAGDLGRWLTVARGGTLPANRQLAAEYLVDLLHADSPDQTVTGNLLDGLVQFKPGVKSE